MQVCGSPHSQALKVQAARGTCMPGGKCWGGLLAPASEVMSDKFLTVRRVGMCTHTPHCSLL